MERNHGTYRRTVLKTLGAGLVAGTVIPGSASARGNVVSQINSNGHWAYFPLGQENWGRQKHPYDYRLGDSRWMAEPAREGGVRMLAKNLTTEDTPPNRNTGFDIHMGPLEDLDSITVTARTEQTQEGEAATLGVGLYIDTSGNGEFFDWERVRGNKESAKPGTAGDDEGFLFIQANGERFKIDDSTPFLLITRSNPNSPPPFLPATFGELKAGEIDGIDGKTHSALYLGVIDPSPETSGPEEAVVESVNIRRA